MNFCSFRRISKFSVLALRSRSAHSSLRDEMRVLNVAEKNSAAKSVAQILSNGRCTTRDGLSVYNKIYEFQYDLHNQRRTMVMTSVSGHLFNYEFIPIYRNWSLSDPVLLFDAVIQKKCLSNDEKIYNTLKREARNCNILIIWTDCDREGENIGQEIITTCQEVNRNMEVYRARFSEITPVSITRAVRNLSRLDENASKAVDVRMELDLRIGAAFTRFQTMRFQRVFDAILSGNIISYGSCQFPTLGFVVERYNEIAAFVSENFWSLRVKHIVGENRVEFKWKRDRVFQEDVASVLLQRCQQTPVAKVLSVKCTKKSKWRPLPLDTVEFEKNCSRKLRINAKEAMRIAENLYRNGYISYPRTETNIFPKELELRPLIEMQTASADWGAFAARVLQDGPTPRQGKNTDSAHPPIHPTRFVDSLNGNERRIYEFVVRHFLACVSRDAQGFATVVEIEIADERFSANGLMITEKNYLDVYIYENWNDKNIPVYTVGQTFTPNCIEMYRGATEPPKLLAEADLIALMEKHGIGTDATHAEHIEKIKSRQYVILREDRFSPSPLGLGLVAGYTAMGFQLSKPDLRAAFEEDLKRICDGRKDATVVLREQIEIYRRIFIETMEKVRTLDEVMARHLGQAVQPHHRPSTEV